MHLYAIYFMIIIFGLLERCICRSCTCSEIGHGQCRMCRPPPPGGDWSWKREVETDAGDAGDASCSPRKVPGMQGSVVRCRYAVSTKLGGFWWRILVDQGALRSLSLSLTERSAGAPLAMQSHFHQKTTESLTGSEGWRKWELNYPNDAAL